MNLIIDHIDYVNVYVMIYDLIPFIKDIYNAAITAIGHLSWTGSSVNTEGLA